MVELMFEFTEEEDKIIDKLVSIQEKMDSQKAIFHKLLVFFIMQFAKDRKIKLWQAVQNYKEEFLRLISRKANELRRKNEKDS